MGEMFDLGGGGFCESWDRDIDEEKRIRDVIFHCTGRIPPEKRSQLITIGTNALKQEGLNRTIDIVMSGTTSTTSGSVKMFNFPTRYVVLEIKKVVFNDPATIVFWEDDTKTVVKCQPGDTYSKELGLAMAFIKRLHNNKGNYNDIFRKWAYDD